MEGVNYSALWFFVVLAVIMLIISLLSGRFFIYSFIWWLVITVVFVLVIKYFLENNNYKVAWGFALFFPALIVVVFLIGLAGASSLLGNLDSEILSKFSSVDKEKVSDIFNYAKTKVDL